MFHHSTQMTLGEKLSTRRDRGYAADLPAPVRPRGRKKRRVRTPDTDVTRGSHCTRSPGPPSVAGRASLIGERHTSNQADERLPRDHVNPILKIPSPTDQSRRRGPPRASIESERPSHASAKSTPSRLWLLDQPRKGRAAAQQRERAQQNVDEDHSDDSNDSTECYLCLQHLDATNRRPCRHCSRTICTGCLRNSDTFLPGHTFGQREEQAASAAASPSGAVSVRSESVYQPAQRVQYMCNYCEETLDTRYFCKVCDINLCDVCLQIHPSEHAIQELQTGPCASSGRPSGYVLGEVSDTEAIPDPDDRLNWNESDQDEPSDTDEPSALDKPRQDQKESGWESQQLLTLQWTPTMVPEELPEQPFLARLSEKPGATLTFERKEVIKVVRHIQDSRRTLALMERAVGAPRLSMRRDNARPAAEHVSLVQSLGTGEVGIDNAMNDGTSSQSSREDGDGEEPAADGGQRALKLGVLRDLLEFDPASLGPRRREKTRQSRRWTAADKQQLRKLKRMGWTNDRIAQTLDRSLSAVLQQWAKQKQ